MGRKTKSLDEQLVGIIRDGMKASLKDRRGHTGVDGIPLVAWMRGAPLGSESKILTIINGVHLPYKHVGWATSDLAQRIARRYSVTWVQKDLIERYLFLRYRGKPPSFCELWAGLVTDAEPLWDVKTTTVDAIAAACGKLKVTISSLPLRVLIDRRLTDTLLLMQLNEALLKSYTKGRPWMPTSSQPSEMCVE